MIILRTLLLTAFVGVLSGAQVNGERWSRQISNSEWIPLANPRNNQKNQNPLSVAPAVAPAAPAPASPIADSSVQAAAQAPAVALPPALQQQYQEQLQQLQKTQESIQKLLMLQQQLKAQQQLLQSHAYQPNFGGPEDEKQALHQSTIVNLQTLPELAPEVLVPPVPSSEALPPVFRAQNFRAPVSNLKSESPFLATSAIVGAEQDYRQQQQHDESITRPSSGGRLRGDSEKDYSAKQKSRYENALRHKEEPSHVNFVTPPTSSEEQEEIQLVYVPAETLAHRGQMKFERPPTRKHNANRHHQLHENGPSSPIPSQEAYAREVLHQLQRQHEEDSQFLKAERQQEANRFNAGQKEIDREAQLQQDLTRNEHDIMRHNEAERKRKEYEKIQEAARRRELIRQQELRDKEYKARQNEIKQKELEKLATLEKDKELKRETDEARLTAQTSHNEDVFDTQYHQHLTEITSKNLKTPRNRNKPRSKLHHFHQQDFPEQEAQPTTPTPNQPPLSVYMGDSLSNHHRIRLADVLKSLKNAKSIAVLDNFAGADTPKVFVGPRHLDPPTGYAKFDLPYLSSIENNRVERKVDKLPFFVAPLSFEPPQGYSKIPFPAPHIGSVVINSLENVEIKPLDTLNPSPNPLIEPNSYVVSNQPSPAYDVTPVSYAQPTTPRYEISSAFPPSQSSTKWRFNDLYENKPSTEIPSTVTAASYNDDRYSTNKYDRPTKTRNYYNPNEVSSTPSYYSPKTITAFSFEQTVPQSTPAYRQESTRQHTVQPHFVNPNIGNFHQTVSRFPDPVTTHQEKNHRYPIDPTGHAVTHSYFVNQSPSLEEQTRYNLPAELPAISPQLPGLVNALVEKAELSSLAQLPVTTPISTTTTTTTEAPTTTFRARTRPRNRVTASRTSSTLSPPSRGNSERTRRPVNRSRSKYTTTTEDYHDSSYDPTRRNTVTTSRYDDQGNLVRKPSSRQNQNQNYKPRDEETKESIQTQIVDSNAPSEQGQRGGGGDGNAYENAPLIDPASSNPSANADNGSLRPHNDGVAPTSNLNIPVYQQDDYSASTVTPSSADNLPQKHSGISDSLLPLAGLEYTRKTTQIPSYQSSSTVRTLGEEQPVNGFNYRTHEIKSSVQPNRDYPFFRPGRTESVRFEPIASTGLPNVQRSQLEDFSPVYHAVSAQDQYEKNETPRPVYQNPSNINNEEDQPIFLPIPQNKQEEYEYQTTIIEGLTETTPEATTIPTTTPTTTTTTTTTEAPVIIRQRVRGRLSGRPAHQDSVIQTRPRGSQDEYVRFSAVNQENSGRTRQRTRPSRTRVQQQQHQHNSPIQTEGQEYVRIQSAPAQTRRPTTTKAPVTEERPAAPAAEEDYGFIKSPNYRPALANHKTTQSQSVESSETTSSEAPSTQAPLLKHRQKYFSATRRPSSPSSRATTPSSSEDQTYTLRSRGRPSHSSEEVKPTKARSRLRRPSSTRKRVSTTTTTTSTTEAALDANNELPIDENYPTRISNQRTQELQADLYNDKNRDLYDRASSQSGKRREHDLTEENYPQEFLLNYGASQSFHRDDYDQAQLASRQQASASTRPRLASRPTADIYGAESQWSTKLTGNSFQPSSFTPNQPPEEGQLKPQVNVGREKAGNFPEIITIGPDDEAGVTVLVSSDVGENSSKEQKVEPISSSEESSIVNSMVNSMVDFGKKMNADDVEGLTAPPETPAQVTTTSTTEYVQSPSTPSPAEVGKPGATFKKAGLKRRRVRVRVRPAGSTPDDFVTAESQSYDSSLNNLPHEPSKFRNFYLTTESSASSAYPSPTTTTTTTTVTPETEKSIFESFLDKMLGGPEEAPSTVMPEMITITANPEETFTNPETTFETTLKDNSGASSSADSHSYPEQPTTLRNREDETGNTELPASAATTTLIDSAEAHSTTSATTEKATPSTVTATTTTTTTTSATSTSTTKTTTTTASDKSDETRSNSGENVIQSLNQDNSLRYFATKSPAFSEYLRSQEKSRLAEQNPAYPKNHRSKWSEVRYPSDKGLFEFGKWSAKNNHSQESASNEQKQNSAESSSDSSVTDYVKAIFESIKSADEEHHQNAKLADEKSSRKEKDLSKPDKAVFPTEIKTSVSSSSRVISSNSQETSGSVSTTNKPTATFGPFVPSMMSDRLPGVLVKKTPLELNLGKILKSTSTTKVTQQTEICYRGRCVMSKPKKEGLSR